VQHTINILLADDFADLPIPVSVDLLNDFAARFVPQVLKNPPPIIMDGGGLMATRILARDLVDDGAFFSR
jgi:hypothetical protein